MEQLTHLEEFLAIPSVSTQELRQHECLLAAKWLVKYLKSNKIKSARLLDSPGLPLVYADVPSVRKNAPTILFYGHYDVQNEGDIQEWDSPPFSVRYKQDRLFARGAADDKGQVITFIDGLLQALADSGGDLAYNVKLLIEGEEEVGSPHIEKVIADNRDLLKADVVYVCDTDMHPDTPQIFLGLRGIAIFTLQLHNAHTDLHSGIYGGAVANPALELARICASLVNQHGEVLIPGFYDDVAPATKFSVDLVNAVKPGFEQLTNRTGAKAFIKNPKFTPQQMTSLLPTLEINALHSGTDLEIASTIIPKSASVRISSRLVPNQKSDKIYKLIADHLAKITPPEFTTYLNYLGGDEAVRYNSDNPHILRAAELSGKIWKHKAKFNYAGGSIGVLASLQKQLGMDAILLGFAFEDANIHGANENFPVDQYFKGKDYIKLLLTAA
jgi:acetylornithine deacetylase/succinyl-diaminopimelate desuccinylase-like protein